MFILFMLIVGQVAAGKFVGQVAAGKFGGLDSTKSGGRGDSYDFLNYDDSVSDLENSKENNLDAMLTDDYFLPMSSNQLAVRQSLNQPMLLSLTPVTMAVTAIAMAVLFGHLFWILTSGFTFDANIFSNWNKKKKDNDDNQVVEAIVKQAARHEASNTSTTTSTTFTTSTTSTTLTTLTSTTVSTTSSSLSSTTLPSLRTLRPSEEARQRNRAYIWGQRQGQKWQLLKTVPQE